MSDTPEVDSVAYEERGMPGSLVVHVDIARRAAREAAAVAEKLEAAKAEITRLIAAETARSVELHESRAGLEKNRSYSRALQQLIEDLTSGKSPTAQPLALDHSRYVLDYAKGLAAKEAKRGQLAEQQAYAASEERRIAAERLAAVTGKLEAMTAHVTVLQARDVELTQLLAETQSHAERLGGIVGLLEGVPPKGTTILAEWQAWRLACVVKK